LNKKLLIRITISAILIFLLLSQTDTDQLLSTLRIVNIPMLLFALFIYILSAILNSFRWYLLIKASNMEFSFPRILSLNFTGLFFSIFLPGRTGGDIARAYYIAKSSDDRVKAISTIIIWRIMGIIALTIIALMASFASFTFIEDKSIIVAIFLIVLLIYTMLYLVNNRKLMKFLFEKLSVLLNKISTNNLESKFETLYNAVHSYQKRQKLLLVNIVIGAVVHLLIISCWYIISQSLDIEISYIYFLLLIPIISLLNTIPISLNGVGVREGAAILLFGNAGLELSQSLSMGLLFSAISLALGLIGGIFYILKK